jgi:hypothetical protein
VSLGRNRARPSRTARAQLAATRAHGPRPCGARPVFAALVRPACAAHVLGRRSVRDLARPARATRGARCERAVAALLSEPTAARWHGAGARETTEERVAHRRGDGGAARRRRVSSGRHSDGWCRRLRTAAVEMAARSGWWHGRQGERRVTRGGRDDGARGEAAVARVRLRRALSGRGCRDTRSRQRP